MTAIAPLAAANPSAFEDTAHGFRISVPADWATRTNIVVGDETIDVLFALPGYQYYEANLIVDSDAYSGDGSSVSARDELETVLRGAEGFDAFRRVTPNTPAVVGGHSAATAMVTWNPSTWTLQQLAVVVVSQENRLKWILIASAATWDFPKFGADFNASIASFEVLPAPQFPAAAATVLPFILVADGAAGVIALAVVLLDRRKRA